MDSQKSSPRPKRHRATSTTVRRAKKGKSTASSVEVPDAQARRFDYDAQVADYKIWRRQGSWHDPVCLECRKPNDLIPCQTCKRVYHMGCMPKTASRASILERFNCLVCTELGWDTSPPLVSPTPSRVPPNLPPPSSDYLRLQGPDSIIAERATSTEQPPARNAGAIASTDTLGKPQSQVEAHTNVSSERSSQGLNISDGTRPYSQRRSRFATLAPKIDGALSLLYQELESSNFLRETISGLEQHVRKLEQDIRILKNQALLNSRQRAAEKISDDELKDLRIKAAAGDAATSELEAARRRIQTLEEEAIQATREIASKDEALKEWKGKLKGLLGE